MKNTDERPIHRPCFRCRGSDTGDDQPIVLNHYLVTWLEETHDGVEANHEAAEIAVNRPPFRKS